MRFFFRSISFCFIVIFFLYFFYFIGSVVEVGIGASDNLLPLWYDTTHSKREIHTAVPDTARARLAKMQDAPAFELSPFANIHARVRDTARSKLADYPWCSARRLSSYPCLSLFMRESGITVLFAQQSCKQSDLLSNRDTGLRKVKSGFPPIHCLLHKR